LSAGFIGLDFNDDCGDLSTVCLGRRLRKAIGLANPVILEEKLNQPPKTTTGNSAPDRV